MKTLLLIILDGWGVRKARQGNAVALARTPNYESFLQSYPHGQLGAAGEAVGLPAGQMGNSEVGHLNLGAGRIVYQEFTRISQAVKDGSFFKNPVLIEAYQRAKRSDGAVHLFGLVSDGGVHSHLDHIYALLKLALNQGVEQVFVHAFLDGRDTPPTSACRYLEELQRKMDELGVGSIATVSGRYYAMDRDRRWERTKRAYVALVYGEGEKAKTPVEAVENAYKRGETDEFVKPTVVNASAAPQSSRDLGLVKEGDTVIFFNFRPDRVRQLTRSFIEPNFREFDRGPAPPNVFLVTLTQYDEELDVPVAFPPVSLKNILADVLSQHGLKQLRIAETEKYAHVTYFFNGGEEVSREGEDRVLIPSPKVATYDLKPEMSAYEVTERVIKEIRREFYHFIVLNYANPDMVGHTGYLEAAVKAIEAVDDCVGKVTKTLLAKGGEVLITGDHGNAEEMSDEEGKPHTAHTTNPVPFIYLGSRSVKLREGGILADVAPTVLALLGLPKPEEMKGQSLFINLQGKKNND
jgi:2,3-bisphosphoglycerate-independent phosphoglycerate mutase